MNWKYLKRDCWLEIDLDTIRSNFAALRSMAGPGIKIMPAVKANAYGHGIVESCRALEEAGADYLGVGCLVYNKNTQNCRGDSPKLQKEIPQ